MRRWLRSFARERTRTSGDRRRHGGVVVIAGPDGTGKSVLADGLVAHLGRTATVRRFHHRLAVLPRSASGTRPTQAPHAAAPYPVLVSWIKVLYLFVDELLGWSFTLRRLRRDGGWAVIERGWWDVVVDPLRYRLRGSSHIARLLGRLLPKPDVTLVLVAPPSTVYRRKAELPLAEVRRQLDVWKELATTLSGAVLIAASGGRDDVLADAIRACESVSGARGSDPDIPSSARRWASLPPGRRPRWLIPSDTGRLARAGLRVYQPMSRSSRFGWEAARLMAGTGLFRVAGRASDPSLRRAVERYVPPGGTFAAIYGRDAGRAVVLLLDAHGTATGIAKVARDEAGSARLAREADRIELLAPHLRAPLSAPRLLEAREGVLLFEPVDWLPQPQPWRLPVALAAAIGRFHESSIEVDGEIGHPGHGDFAPWNILRTEDGWVLLDWEEASASAPPFADPFHYLVSTHTLLGRPSAGELLRGLEGEGWIGDALRTYAKAASLTRDRRAAFTEYLRTSIGRLRPFHPDTERGRRSRLRLLRALGVRD